MRITIITLFPKMVGCFFKESILKKAQEKGLVEIELIDLRKFAINEYGQVDDRPYGGGAGMIIRIDVLKKALESVNVKHKTVLTSAKGKVYNQDKAQKYSQLDHLVIIAGHYEGVDERVMDYVDEEISLGDFVMTGGEITAASIVDSVVRLIPGVLKKEEATEQESFFNVSINQLIEAVGETEVLIKLKNKGVENVRLLEYPQYTRPEDFEGRRVPEILLSGNHAEIKKWQLKQAYEETTKKRPDLLFPC